MFDRLYRIWITHTALKGGALQIIGDSSRPSLDIEFSSNLNRSEVSKCNGSLTIRGLSKEHIDALSAIRRHEFAKNSSEHNMVTLAVGYRDSKIEPKYDIDSDKQNLDLTATYTIILQGRIMEAIPGPNPDRSITMSLNATKLDGTLVDAGLINQTEILTDVGGEFRDYVQTSTASMKVWMQKCADKINLNPKSNYQVTIDERCDDVDVTPITTEINSVKDFQNIVTSYGYEWEELVASYSADEEDKEPKVLNLVTIRSPNDLKQRKIPRLISQETGMIGIPTSIPMGAKVDVILREPILLGEIVNLQSKMFPKLSSDPKLYSDDGLYIVLGTEFIGSFRGNNWLQRLTLNRGAVVMNGGTQGEEKK